LKRDVVHHARHLHARGREDLGEAGLQLAVEFGAILSRDTEELGKGIKRLATALCDVAGQVVHVSDHELVQLLIAYEILRLRAFGSTGRNAKGLVAVNTIGGRLE